MMNILVRVPKQRKCPASIDVKEFESDTSVLSFGDLETPNTDVEVEFAFMQLKDLKTVVDEAIAKIESERERRRRRLTETQQRVAHYGSC